jgi:hypothetical protein
VGRRADVQRARRGKEHKVKHIERRFTLEEEDAVKADATAAYAGPGGTLAVCAV